MKCILDLFSKLTKQKAPSKVNEDNKKYIKKINKENNNRTKTRCILLNKYFG